MVTKWNERNGEVEEKWIYENDNRYVTVSTIEYLSVTNCNDSEHETWNGHCNNTLKISWKKRWNEIDQIEKDQREQLLLLFVASKELWKT